jgi:hypothetical protein
MKFEAGDRMKVLPASSKYAQGLSGMRWVNCGGAKRPLKLTCERLAVLVKPDGGAAGYVRDLIIEGDFLPCSGGVFAFVDVGGDGGGADGSAEGPFEAGN